MTPAERAATIAQTARERAAPTRERNRAEMPETAAILDDIRRVFGKPQWFRFKENGRVVEYGRQP